MKRSAILDIQAIAMSERASRKKRVGYPALRIVRAALRRPAVYVSMRFFPREKI